MEIILLEHVEKLGKMGDKVHVKSGYARNYLLPQNKALRATEANVAYFEKQRAELEARNKALFEEATKKAEAFPWLLSARRPKPASCTVRLPSAISLMRLTRPGLNWNAVSFRWTSRLNIWAFIRLN